MLHSLALAPGEATRVAVIDWSRRSSTTASESIDERERLDNSTNHARAISEVQNAVADEMQSGGSIATGWAKSASHASGFAASIGGGAAGVIGGIAGAIGFGGGGSSSSQDSETNSRATSTSWSHGSRSVMAEMEQRVNDRTEQHATSVRNRRATAVREISQTEHEQVSTRIVANYNHMHALTVQYYEVVQIYRVSVELNSFTRALFLPFELLDFGGANAADLVSRFRAQLLTAALTPRAVELLRDDQGRIELHSAVRVRLPISVGAVANANLAVFSARLSRASTDLASTAENAPTTAVDVGDSVSSPTATAGGSRFTVVRPGPVVEVLPGDATLVSIAFEDVGVDRVRIDQPGIAAEGSTFVVPAATGQVDFPTPIPVRAIEAIHLARDAGALAEGSMVLRYDTGGSLSIAVVPLSLVAGTAMQKAAFLKGDVADRRKELFTHLQGNRAYYTRAVLEGLDAASLVLLLSGVSWLGKPLVDQVEPNPIAVTGNFLVLRAPAEDSDASGLAGFATWGDLLKDRGMTVPRNNARLVPIPTGGVFAEAVLGRSNSAEKLDITRFWNWQDSPIPLTPPEIAPITTGSRASDENLTPGQLGAPVVTVQQPTTLVDPAGLGASLGALASANLFRDMSGLAGTQATAQAAAAGTLDAATEAGRIASANFQAATTQATEMGKAAANMFSALKGKDGGGSGTAGGAESGSGAKGGISGDGARINQGRDMDQRGVTGATRGPSRTAGGGAAGDGAGPTFAPDIMPGVTMPSMMRPRELDYADQSAAVSPGLLGETMSALGVTMQPASFISALADPLGTARRFGEDLVLELMRADAATSGTSLQGVELLPMRLHDNNAEFMSVHYLAWTNSSTRIYVNLPEFVDIFTSAATGKGLASVRAAAIYVLRHEKHHVTQFAGNGNATPADFAAMMTFEEQAYGSDVLWIQGPTIQTLLVTALGAPQNLVDTLEQNAADTSKTMHDWLNDPALTTNAQRQQAMQAAPDLMIPKTIRGKTNYAIGDMYRTKNP
ncbi:MAG: hypothetical protein ABI275_06665 [Terrimesophilobacter sp.]